MDQPFRLYLVRHGQTELNRDGRFRGLSDASLNDRGRLEARGAAGILSDTEISFICSSPLPRAMETARIMAESLGVRVEAVSAFTDVDYGQWQGLTVEQVVERYSPEMLESWREDPGSFAFPGGEGMESVRSRLEPALERLAADGDRDIAVVSHLAVLKVCFVILLELPFEYFWKIGLDNGSVSLFTLKGDGSFVLDWWNRLNRIGTD